LQTESIAVAGPCDVVILGAGIAGLLLAAELSQRHSVVVVEQAKAIPTHKYWLTDGPSAARHPHLARAIDGRYAAMEFRGCDGSCYTVRGDYVLWDTPRLTSTLYNAALANGARFLLDHRFLTLRHERRDIVVIANEKEITARLAVDCMGYASPIVYAKDIVRIHGYYALFGATFDLAEPLVPVALHNVALSAEPVYLEAFPTADGRVHLTVIVPARDRRPSTSLAQDLKTLTERSPYARHLRRTGRPPAFLGGIVPVGRLRTPALDRLYFFGEAGQANPAASATALTRMLYTYRDVAAGLTAALERDRLSRRELCAVTPATLSALNRRVQLALFDRILDFDSDDFAAVVRELERIDDAAFVNGLMFATLPFGLVDAIALLRSLMAARCVTLLRAVLRALLRP
jgi:hypothetical protein